MNNLEFKKEGEKMRKRIFCILIITLLILTGLFYPLKGNAVIKEKDNATSEEAFFKITPIATASNDNYGINSNEIAKESSFDDINYIKGELEVYDGPDAFYYLEPYGHSADEDLKVDLNEWKTPLSEVSVLDGGVTSPPWYDCDHGTEVIKWFLSPFHSEYSSVNCNVGSGSLSLDASCGWSMAIETHAWCWFQGYYDCTQTGEYAINFKIDYDGLVRAVDAPIKTGLGVLSMEANAAYKFGNFETGKKLIFLRDSWPNAGEYHIPGPYEPDGPYEIGYPTEKILEEGHRYYFVVQFNVWLDCAATFFTVSGGGIDLNVWFQKAIVSSLPSNVDFVTSGTVKIGDDLYLAIYPEPLYFSPGSTVKLHANVWNDGSEDAACHVAIGLDTNAWYDGPFTIPAGGINNGVHFVLNNFQWPNDLNIHSIICIADCFDKVNEINEDNNFGYFEWAAVGPPNVKIPGITLMKYNASNWPPDPKDINWGAPDEFYSGDQVIPLAKVSNSGVGPSLNLVVKYYWDNTLKAQVGPFGLRSNGWVIFVVSENTEGDPPGIIWPDEQGHKIKWVIEDLDYGQSDTKKQTYYPKQKPEPKIELTPSEYNYGEVKVGEYKDYAFKLKNTGNARATGSISIAGDSDFSIQNNVNSFDLSPDNSIDITVRFEPSSKESKSATLKADGNDPCNDVNSYLLGIGAGSLKVTPKNLDFELAHKETSSKQFTIQNVGNANLSWSITETESWMTVNPTSGTLYSGKSTNILVTVTAPDTPNAEYDGVINIDSDDGSTSVTVHLTVKGPKLYVTPSKLNFAGMAPSSVDSSQITIKNDGIGTLEWSASDNTNWIKSIDPSSGMLEAGKSQLVTITVQAPNQKNGNWDGKVTIISNGGNKDITITLTTTKPRLRLPLIDIIQLLSQKFQHLSPIISFFTRINQNTY